ncbi:anthranilate phosphoribosyltransferase [Aquifex aeolicus]|uniref:Anthranilate phosphoribosyltransferase n=1 Tax=Aquifex aeolicus (strain VF5) TaxID=224324 RepID=TRPD_AQUAE|nr:anthranilate phosphoribosyltransferase [Aquifex aeolicus]O66576.1 RecName: Full=Anthranilate phosphoribosyltransferase [Aquifex aeolicus VF5]AAC06519.1 phosphoribosylanthranilate transferase [Aquifex aeolicus VF5]
MELVRELLRKIAEFENLTAEEMYNLMKEVAEGRATDAQIGALVMGTKMKGETPEEIEGAVKLFREKVVRVPVKDPEELVDVVGTGGDKSSTFNVSTVTGFVLAGAGVKVAKHGNRSVSSKSGSADFLEALGAKVELLPEKVARLIEEVGFGFMFAPLFHPAMKRVVSPRREVGVRSIFNLIGPLTNPAGVKRYLLGVFSKEYVDKFAKALKNLGVKKAFVVHGEGGIDEVSVEGETYVTEVSEEGIRSFTFSPEELGVKRKSLSEVRVNSPEESVKVALSVLRGEEGTPRDMVLLNASFGILVSERAGDIKEAFEMAKESIDSGKALEVLEKYVELSNKI